MSWKDVAKHTELPTLRDTTGHAAQEKPHTGDTQNTGDRHIQHGMKGRGQNSRENHTIPRLTMLGTKMVLGF